MSRAEMVRYVFDETMLRKGAAIHSLLVSLTIRSEHLTKLNSALAGTAFPTQADVPTRFTPAPAPPATALSPGSPDRRG